MEESHPDTWPYCGQFQRHKHWMLECWIKSVEVSDLVNICKSHRLSFQGSELEFVWENHESIKWSFTLWAIHYVLPITIWPRTVNVFEPHSVMSSNRISSLWSPLWTRLICAIWLSRTNLSKKLHNFESFFYWCVNKIHEMNIHLSWVHMIISFCARASMENTDNMKNFVKVDMWAYCGHFQLVPPCTSSHSWIKSEIVSSD